MPKNAISLRNIRMLEYGLVVLPFLVYVRHALLFRNWIVDDAGISFSCARSLAMGHGLVSQPGLPPVEGYSNTLWVLVLAPFFRLGLFNPIIVPKVVSGVLVLMSFVLIYAIVIQALRASKLAALLILSLLAMNTSFVVWTTSGLENALYTFVVVSLCIPILRASQCRVLGRSDAIVAGILASGAALTRPDGIVYCILYPFAVLVLWLFDRRSSGRGHLGAILAYALTCGALMGGFLAFRMAYFHDTLPNTFYAKTGRSFSVSLSDILTVKSAAVGRVYELVKGTAGQMVGLTLFAALVLTVHQISLRRLRAGHYVMLLFLLASGSIYLLLPMDWMGGTDSPRHSLCSSIAISLRWRS